MEQAQVDQLLEMLTKVGQAVDNVATTLATVGTRLDHRAMLEGSHQVRELVSIRTSTAALVLAAEAQLRGSEWETIRETIPGYRVTWYYLRDLARWFVRGGRVPRFL